MRFIGSKWFDARLLFFVWQQLALELQQFRREIDKMISLEWYSENELSRIRSPSRADSLANCEMPQFVIWSARESNFSIANEIFFCFCSSSFSVNYNSRLRIKLKRSKENIAEAHKLAESSNVTSTHCWSDWKNAIESAKVPTKTLMNFSHLWSTHGFSLL